MEVLKLKPSRCVNCKPATRWNLLIAVVLFGVVAIRFPVGMELRAAFEFSVRVAIVFLFAAYLMEVNPWIGFFLLLSLFSHTVPVMFVGKHMALHSQQSYIALDWVVFGCLLFYIIYERCSSLNIILNCMCIVALFHIAWVICQNLGVDPSPIYGMKGNLTKTGLMANRNEAGALIAILSAAFFRPKWCVFLPVVALGSVLSWSLGGQLGVCASGVAYLTLHKKRYWPTIGIVAGGIGLYVLSNDNDLVSYSQRLFIWKKAIVITYDNHPLLGWGLGQWVLVNDVLTKAQYWGGSSYGVASWSRTHNSFIQAYAEMGIAFIPILTGYVIHTIRCYHAGMLVPLAAMGAVFVGCNVNSLFRMNMIVGMFIIVWIAILQRTQNGYNNSQEHNTESTKGYTGDSCDCRQRVFRG